MSDIANNGLSNCLTKDGQQTPTNNIPMGGFRITGLGDAVNATDAVNARQIQTGAFNTLSVVTGTDTITGVTSPSFGSYAPGQRFQFLSAGANTTNSVTLNINSLGAKNVLKSGATPIVPGDIAAGQMVTVVYDGTQFELVSPASIPGHGNCILTVTSSTTLTLAPYNGNKLIINGSYYQVPSAGVGLGNGGLSASTKYFIYAFVSAGVITLLASATGHQTGTNGVEIMTGDPTRTLVGMIFTNASSQFVDNTTTRTCFSWFNRTMKPIALTGVGSTTSNTAVTISTGIFFLQWADGGVSIGVSGTISNNTAGANTQSTITIDGSPFGANSFFSPFAANANGAISTRISGQFAEGAHTMFLSGLVGAGTGSWTYAIDGFVLG
jgi:hypothetical protein